MMGSRSQHLREALRQVDDAMARGDLAAAESLARRIVAGNPLAAPAQFSLGIAVQASGRFEQAEPHLARAVTLDGQNTNYRLNYGLCLLSMGRVPEAAVQYGKAREIAPKSFETAWRYGSFQSRIGHMEEALASLEQALAKAPEQARPAIRLDMLECLLSLGRIEDAEQLIARHLESTPFRARYVCLLSSTRKHDADSMMFRMVEQELASSRLSSLDRSDLMIRRGVMLQNSRRFDEAFDSFVAGKKLLKAPSVTAAFTREVEQRIARFDRDSMEQLQARYGRSEYAPIFVLGLPRSGTTLAAQIISAHSRAGNAGELETMTYVAAKFSGMASEEAASALATLYEKTLRYVVPDKELAVDKMPLNFRFIAEAAILFPKARFVHCTRHAADTFISALQTEMNAAHSYSYDPADYAAYHKQYRRLMEHWGQVLPGRVFDLSYERLVIEPEPTINALLDYLGLDPEEACFHPERNKGAVATFSRLQVRLGINTGSVARWKPYERHLGPILAESES
ncbi:tetratricopeptide repeat-containing sulfotransferase family protein [Aestuariivirga sp.]|uniref:tetratricopeptide repeat-containing sulfotransferase family protein n=1 Tax=Aestuariivirga sp. TaxID=2650926 RepID=UPI003BAA27DE